MKRIFFWIALLLAIALLAPGSAFAVPAQVTVGNRTGTSGTLDALECEDITSVSPPGTPRAIATGDRAVAWASDGIWFYVYNATGTDSESDPWIIVPNDRADCSNQGQWEMKQVYFGLDPGVDRGVFWDDSESKYAFWTAGTGLSFSTSTLTLHAYLQDIVGITAQKGDILYYTGSIWDELDANDSDKEGYIPQLTGANPNSVLAYVNTLNFLDFYFPQANDPAPTVEGSAHYDKNNRAIEMRDGSSNNQLIATIRKMSAAVIPDPDNLPVSIVTIFDVEAEKFPFGIILKKAWIECDSVPSADYVVVIEEWSGGSGGTGKAAQTDCATLTLTGSTDYEDNTTTINANCSGSTSGIDAGDLIRADFDNTDWAAEDFDECIIGITYEIEDGN